MQRQATRRPRRGVVGRELGRAGEIRERALEIVTTTALGEEAAAQVRFSRGFGVRGQAETFARPSVWRRGAGDGGEAEDDNRHERDGRDREAEWTTPAGRQREGRAVGGRDRSRGWRAIDRLLPRSGTAPFCGDGAGITLATGAMNR